MRYRDECLAHGGGKPSHLLVGDHLGCQLAPDQLAAALIQAGEYLAQEKFENIFEF